LQLAKHLPVDEIGKKIGEKSDEKNVKKNGKKHDKKTVKKQGKGYSRPLLLAKVVLLLLHLSVSKSICTTMAGMSLSDVYQKRKRQLSVKHGAALEETGAIAAAL